ncbi:mandelate racemase/muconate lactonizing enzyme family protein [Caldovatus aquaticus]|uniref:Mandelate racemase/muconate lactonizing enzyme family protein n=1 Tax=Caldovatus aquaticus TaxID=2865671 RepID=A0ABS7F4G3_9PROT|nr:mandelate racemase/muconate lactonizing enzyme family protein [Caldovatus aquaticus]MBW8270413.1 mandelate racemase/muconate lactonizing enzyme family protein [Caldovatus aquaticus]
MSIRSIAALPIILPFEVPGPRPLFAGRPRETVPTLLVRVETSDGIVGWGEAFSHAAWAPTATALTEVVAPLALGRDETAIAALALEIQKTLHLFGRSGPVTYALSGLEIALWDIAGKAAGRPLHALLGGARRERLPAYASLPRYADPAAVARVGAAAVARGYRAVKLHETGIEQVRAARAAIGGEVALMLDANCAWSVAEALERAARLRPFGLHWLEEPVWPPEDHAGLARVRREGGVRTAAGENAASPTECAAMMAAGAVDVIQPSVTKIGGVAAWLEVARAARAQGVAVVPHSPYFGPGFLATLHLCATLAEEVRVERMDFDLPANPFGATIVPREGWLSVPQGPGLGADPDPEIIARYRAA